MAARIAAFQCSDSSIAQREMLAAIDRLQREGIRIVGVVEERDPNITATCTAGTLRDINSSASHRIYLDTPRADTSCRVDSSGVEAAASGLLAQIPAADLVVLSKFGKLEAGGGGLFPVLEAAVAAGKPVITTVSENHRDAWQAYAPSSRALTSATEAVDWFVSARPGLIRQTL
jgi:nucleoside-triphosphatase THEP1